MPTANTRKQVESATARAVDDRAIKYGVFIFSSYTMVNSFILFRSWARQSMHALTENLLGLIEENATVGMSIQKHAAAIVRGSIIVCMSHILTCTFCCFLYS
jgi:hypothetical protein